MKLSHPNKWDNGAATLRSMHPSCIFYSGVSDQAKATPIAVSAGQTQSNLEVSAAARETYSVRGLISSKEKPPAAGPGGVSVMLVPLDGGPTTRWHWQNVDFQGLLYFDLEKVLPGCYSAFAASYGNGWFTTRVDITVTSHSKFIFLKLADSSCMETMLG